MQKIGPRDIRMATTVGGGLIGIVLSALGSICLIATFSPSVVLVGQYAVAGVTLLAIGSTFLLVTVFVLPASHASRIELLERKN